MAALAGVGSYSIVFHTKIARSSRRACNFMIRKGECAPAVFSIPIARSTFRCFPLAFVLGEAFARSSVSKASMRPNSSHSLRILRMQNGTSVAAPPTSEIQRQGCAFVRQSTNYSGWTNQSDCLTILPIVRMGANQYGVRNNYQ